MGLKLNLGCGRSPAAGWVNVDLASLPGVDVVADLDACRTTRLPFANDSVSHFQMLHVLEHIKDNPRSSGRQLEAAMSPLGHRRGDVRSALKRGRDTHQIEVTAGPKGAYLHSLGVSAPTSPELRQPTEAVCASAPLGRTRAHTQQLEEAPLAHSVNLANYAYPDPD